MNLSRHKNRLCNTTLTAVAVAVGITTALISANVGIASSIAVGIGVGWLFSNRKAGTSNGPLDE